MCKSVNHIERTVQTHYNYLSLLVGLVKRSVRDEIYLYKYPRFERRENPGATSLRTLNHRTWWFARIQLVFGVAGLNID